MSTTPALKPVTPMTRVRGYYNGARWAIQIVVSRFNVTLTLKPGEYLLDRQGRKINDPYFEVFANNKQLARELSDVDVPILHVPVVTNASIATQPSNPVHSVTQWTRDAKGHRQPVLPGSRPPAPAPEPLPSSILSTTASATSANSVRPMTMDEARRQGLVRKVREVPEDYGINDTTGLPPAGMPKMRYATDSSMLKPAPALPKELLELPSGDANNPTRSQIVQGLQQSSKTPVPELAPAHPFANAGTANAPEGSQLTAGIPAQLQESVAPTPPGEPVGELMAGAPLPEYPAVDEPPLDEPLPEPVFAQDAPPDQDAPPAAVPLRPLTAPEGYRCAACGVGFKFRSMLQKHAVAKHAGKVNVIMQQYPLEQ